MTIKTILISLTLSLSMSCWGQSNDPKFSQQQVLSDLEYLYNTLEQTHYDLYAYTPKEELQHIYDQLKTGIKKDSMSLLEITSSYQRLTSSVNNGHTEIFFPSQSYRNYAYNGGTLFPLELAFENGKALVRKDWSKTSSLETGAEVLTINGKPIQEILHEMYPHISAEREYFKLAKLELFSFPRMYWQIYGQLERFDVQIKTSNGVQSLQLEAIDLIEDYEMVREEVLNAQMKLEYLSGAAYLNPGDLSGDMEVYKQFVDSAFQNINEQGVETLIIDLRNNRGGDDTFSDYLVSYIADKPFKWNANFCVRTSALLKKHISNKEKLSDFDQAMLDHQNGEQFAYDFGSTQPQPAGKRFQGEVYVLVNRQSYSQSTVTAAQIQDYGFGEIVGEETGEFPSLFASIFSFYLPETGIEVKVSKGHITRVNGSIMAEGVIPDIVIQDHLLDQEDEILEGLLQQINQS